MSRLDKIIKYYVEEHPRYKGTVFVNDDDIEEVIQLLNNTNNVVIQL